MKQQDKNIYQRLTDHDLRLAALAVEQYLEAWLVAIKHGLPVPEGPSVTIGNVAVPVRDMAPGAVQRLFDEHQARQQSSGEPAEPMPRRVPDSTRDPWRPWDNPEDYYNARAEGEELCG